MEIKVERNQIYEHYKNKKIYVVERMLGIQLFGKWFYFVLYIELMKDGFWFVRTLKNFEKSFRFIGMRRVLGENYDG